jgi:hypothetical protein
MSRHLVAAASLAALFTASSFTAASAQMTPAPMRTPIRPGVALPDLTIEDAWLALPNGRRVKGVSVHSAYLACFLVANIGAAPSGIFRVQGGGLGIKIGPYQTYGSLGPGATRQGCLSYPTTPAPGTYNLGLEADSLHVVRESNESNNTAVIQVIVHPF